VKAASVVQEDNMYFKKLKEAGFEEALFGLSLSYYDHAIPPFHMNAFTSSLEDSRMATIGIDYKNEKDTFFWTQERYTKAVHRCLKQAHMQGGHNKFLESITVWLYIQASRDFWQEFDTYRAGITKQSSSTMHTLDKRAVTYLDFEIGTHPDSINIFNLCLTNYKDEKHPAYKDISTLKKNLPEGWLQERQITTNYKVLQHIYRQRKNHRLKQWKQVIEDLLIQLDHPYLIKEELLDA
jgi:hypothetical protein